MKRTACTAIALLLPALAGCRGDRSDSPPVHLNPNMDNVERYDPQEPDPFFKDGRSMRPEVPGTVARGELKVNAHMFRGTVGGKPAETLPLKLTRGLLQRGQQRFGIYCAVCHGGAGTGDGIVVKRGMLPPPSFHEDRVRAMPVGHIFQVISKGVRNMPSYAAQIPERDRWAIVSYVRALQVGHSAKLKDVPEDIAASKGWSKQ